MMIMGTSNHFLSSAKGYLQFTGFLRIGSAVRPYDGLRERGERCNQRQAVRK